MSARLLALGFALLAAAFLPARADEACPPFRELRPARMARDRSVLIFTRSVDPAWFDCARRAGGKVSGRSEVERGGAWDVDSQSGRLGADLRLDAWASNYCGRSGKADPARVRFVVEATGPLAPLGATTEPLPALCGCTVYPTTELQLTPSPAGLSLRGKLTAPHLACLRAGGGSLEVRAYTGRTVEEAMARARPAWVLRGVESKAELGATIPRKALCAGGAKEVVVELAGRGMLSELTGAGRVQAHLDCR